MTDKVEVQLHRVTYDEVMKLAPYMSRVLSEKVPGLFADTFKPTPSQVIAYAVGYMNALHERTENE